MPRPLLALVPLLALANVDAQRLTLSTACAAPCAACTTSSGAGAGAGTTGLCVAPAADARAWRFRFVAVPSDAPRTADAVTLDAAAVERVRDFALPSGVWSLALEAESAPPTLALDADTLTQWQNLETLYGCDERERGRVMAHVDADGGYGDTAGRSRTSTSRASTCCPSSPNSRRCACAVHGEVPAV